MASRLVKIAGALAIAFVFFALVMFLLLQHLIEAGEFRRLFITEIEQRTGLKASFGAVGIELGGVTAISLHDFSLIAPDSSHPVLVAPKVVTQVALLPLWNWQIVVQKIHFQEPTLRVSRDTAGEVDILEILARVFLRKGKELPFVLDLKELGMERGQITFHDAYEKLIPLVTELRATDFNLRRVGSRGIFSLLPAAVEEKAAPSEEKSALDYRLKAIVQREEDEARISSRGSVLFHGEGFHLRQASWDTTLQVEDWPAGLLREYYQDYWPSVSWSGTLGAQLRLTGSFADKISLEGSAVFSRLKIRSSRTLEETHSPGDGRLELEMEWEPKQIRVKHVRLTSEEISLAGAGRAMLQEAANPYLQIRLSTPFLRLLAVRGYLPNSLGSARWQSFLRSLKQGEARLANLEMSGRLADVGQLSSASLAARIAFVAEVRGAAIDPEGGYLPVRDLGGYLTLEKDVLYFRNLHGTYGRSRFDNVTGSGSGFLSGISLLEAHVQGEADLEEAHRQLKLELFPETLREAAAKIYGVRGKAPIDLSIRSDLKSAPQFQGQIVLGDADIETNRFVLNEIKGRINISPREITMDRGVASLAGSSLSLSGGVRNYASEAGIFELTAESAGVSAGEVSRLLFGSGSVQDPGTVRGWLRYRVPLAKEGQPKLTGVLDLLGTRPPIDFFREPPREVSGTVKLDGTTIELQAVRASVGKFELEVSGRLDLAEKPRFAFALTAAELDLDLLLPRETSGTAGWYDRLEVVGKLDVGRGRFDGFEFSNLTTDLVLAQRLWRLENFAAGSSGGTIVGRASFLDRPKGVDYVLEPKIQEVPIEIAELV